MKELGLGIGSILSCYIFCHDITNNNNNNSVRPCTYTPYYNIILIHTILLPDRILCLLSQAQCCFFTPFQIAILTCELTYSTDRGFELSGWILYIYINTAARLLGNPYPLATARTSHARSFLTNGTDSHT